MYSLMSTESPVNTYKPGLCPPLYIIAIIPDSMNMQKYHIGYVALVLIIRHFDMYCKSLFFPSHLFCCWVYGSLDLTMINNSLIIICIIVTEIYSYLELSYLSSCGIPRSFHISIIQITPYDLDFIGATKTKLLEVNTCKILSPNSDNNFM